MLPFSPDSMSLHELWKTHAILETCIMFEPASDKQKEKWRRWLKEIEQELESRRSDQR